ncbi:trafficking protein particle complex subunit 6b [Pelomyxa schiedti]|nr:trafficking protein particle complex subunit 6b [Pelomyxa schiedti]
MTREVNSCLVEYLHMEIVSYVQRLVGSNFDAGPTVLVKLGESVGSAVVERLVKDKPLFQDTLSMFRFICKEFWIAIFRKQADNLRTNNKGVYAIIDSQFTWLSHMSFPADLVTATTSTSPTKPSLEPATRRTEALVLYTSFFCGVVKGALETLGLKCDIAADASALPACTFTVRVRNQ